MVCAAAFVVTPNLDANGDGSIDTEDLKATVEKVYLKYPPKSSIHHIRFGERIYDVNLKPAPEDEVDFDASDVRINGISVKRTSDEQFITGKQLTPITVMR
ncbi:hypothetical protein ADL19_14845 [Streptomyces purpurogeneiscleroticus]|nr:hypothetical protein ADL19_14845 [Streptomyces purpurogeneiscleroticus]